jgi:hypothetical protein
MKAGSVLIEQVFQSKAFLACTMVKFLDIEQFPVVTRSVSQKVKWRATNDKEMAISAHGPLFGEIVP